jgi:transposase
MLLLPVLPRLTWPCLLRIPSAACAALDQVGGLLEVAEFPATASGHRRLLDWLAGFGPVARVGVEGTGSHGAGLARYLRAGVEVVGVDRPNRQARRRSGKSDPLDAIEAARAALSGRACGAAKTRDGNVEAISALVVVKRSARSAKIKTLNQIRHLSLTAPSSCGSVSRTSPASAWPPRRRRCGPASGKAWTR